jgi:gluconate 2-dehydrogenase gamma chain
MSCTASLQPSRRALLGSAAAFFFVGTTLARARTLAGGLPWEAGTATPPVVVRPGPWMFFTADEAAVIEAAVDRLIPPDNRGPGGKDAGCAVFIDRQLAGPYGRAEGLYTRPPFMPGAATQGYQLPDSPAARYRAGLKALADYIRAISPENPFAISRPAIRTPCSRGWSRVRSS